MSEEVGPKQQFQEYFPNSSDPTDEGFSAGTELDDEIQPMVKFTCRVMPVKSDKQYLSEDVSWEVTAVSRWDVYHATIPTEELEDEEGAVVPRTATAQVDQDSGDISFSPTPNED